MNHLLALLTEFRSNDGLRGQLLRGGFWSLVIKVLSTLMALLTAVVLARVLGAEGFGIYSFAFALVSVLAIPAQLGLPNLVVRETARAQVAAQWSLMKGLWRWSSFVSLGMSLFLMFLGGFGALAFANRLGEDQVTTLYWGLLLIPLVALGNLRGAALRGLRRVVQGQLPELVLRPLFLVIIVLFAVQLSASDPSSADVMKFHALASLAAFSVGAILLLGARPPELRHEKRIEIHGKVWLSQVLPFAAIGLMNQAAAQTDILVLSLLGTPVEVGSYKLAVQAASIPAIGLSAVSMLMAPHFSSLFYSGRIEKLQRAVSIGTTVSLGFTSLGCLAIFLFGGPILIALVGDEFRASILPMHILLLSQLAGSFVANAGTLLSMTGFEKSAATVIFCALLINVALNLVFIPAFGIEGAAASSVATLLLKCVAFWYLAKKRLNIDPTMLGLLNRK